MVTNANNIITLYLNKELVLGCSFFFIIIIIIIIIFLPVFLVHSNPNCENSRGC